MIITGILKHRYILTVTIGIWAIGLLILTTLLKVAVEVKKAR